MFRAMTAIAAVSMMMTAPASASARLQNSAEPRGDESARLIISVRDAALAAIKGVPASGKVADYEAALVYAIDRLRQPCPIVRDGLELAYAQTKLTPAREAIRNVQQMCARLSGTGSVGSGWATSIGRVGPGLGGGGGGVGNYTPQN